MLAGVQVFRRRLFFVRDSRPARSAGMAVTYDLYTIAENLSALALAVRVDPAVR